MALEPGAQPMCPAGVAVARAEGRLRARFPHPSADPPSPPERSHLLSPLAAHPAPTGPGTDCQRRRASECPARPSCLGPKAEGPWLPGARLPGRPGGGPDRLGSARLARLARLAGLN